MICIKSKLYKEKKGLFLFTENILAHRCSVNKYWPFTAVPLEGVGGAPPRNKAVMVTVMVTVTVTFAAGEVSVFISLGGEGKRECSVRVILLRGTPAKEVKSRKGASF